MLRNRSAKAKLRLSNLNSRNLSNLFTHPYYTINTLNPINGFGNQTIEEPLFLKLFAQAVSSYVASCKSYSILATPKVIALLTFVALVYRRSRHNLNHQYLRRIQEFAQQRRPASLDPAVAAAIGDNKAPRNPLHHILLH